MNIIFESDKAEQEAREYASDARWNGSNTDRGTVSQTNARGAANARGIFALDISGTVMDNTAYESQGKTVEEVMQDAGQQDIATQKDYMVVMSNVMSDEDFAKLQEEGYHPGDTEIETVVTIVDEIKAALIRGGSYIAGYTDDLDMEKLEEITGSVVLAEEIVKQLGKYDIPPTEENVEGVMNAYDTIKQLKPLNDGAIKYMIRNHMEPTVDNIYRAQYSSSSDANKQGRGYFQDAAGYYAKKAEDFNWEQLQPQMEKVIAQAGLTVSEETLEEARWLIEKGMPLTEQSLHELYELKNLKIPDTEKEIVQRACSAIADGRKATDANLGDGRTALEKAVEYMEDVEAISERAVDQAAAEGKTLNLRILKACQMQLNRNIGVERHVSHYEPQLESRRLLEEVRLQMTVEANYRLLKSGFSVDTAQLEKLVNALKDVNRQTEERLFGESGVGSAANRSAIYRDTLSTVQELAGMPAALIGKFSFHSRLQLQVSSSAGAGVFTLRAAYEEGVSLRSAYEKAGESYEALMTAPKAELGDSLEKAFRNVDSMLRDMGMELSDANRRAVRILGYNHMEVSVENVVSVKIADLSIQRVLNKMTPAATMQMIRDGINPLSMDMQQLESYLNNQERNPEQEFEKYSKYLYKLEKNHAVTKEEKEAYIGIYRLLRQLEKTDGAAIGALLQQGAEPTLKNLLTAVRSGKRRGMDIKVDDSFQGVEFTRQSKSISEQIESNIMILYYQKLSSELYDKVDGDRMGALMANSANSMEQAAEAVGNAQEDEESEQEYVKWQASQFRREVVAEDTVIRELLDFKQPMTADHLAAAGMLMKERGKAAARLYQLAQENGSQEELEEAMARLQENMEDADAAQEAYEQLGQVYREVLEAAVYGQDDIRQIDVREISNLYKQISLGGSMAKEENYEVPVKIGDEVTSINLKILHKSGERGKAVATMDTLHYGKVAAQFYLTGKEDGGFQMSSFIACESAEGAEHFKQSLGRLKEMLQYADIEVTGMNVAQSGGLDLAQASRESVREKDAEASGRLEASTKKLYETAKIFIQYIQER